MNVNSRMVYSADMSTTKKRDTRDRSEYQRKRREMFPELFAERHRKWRKANPEKHYANSRKWIEKNPEWRREYNQKYRAKRAGLISTVTRPRPHLCECCGGHNEGKILCLDHCHATNTFRGWLCTACNRGIGSLGDTVESIEKALAYLKRAESAV